MVDLTQKDVDDMALLLYGVPYRDLHVRDKQLDVVVELFKRHMPYGSKVILTEAGNINVELPPPG